MAVYNRPFSLGGHVKSHENKKLCFCTASLALNSRVGEANRAEKCKAFYSHETQHGRRVRKTTGKKWVQCTFIFF